MRVILRNSNLVFETTKEVVYDYTSEYFNINAYVAEQPVAIGSTVQINASSSTDGISSYYRVPCKLGNKVEVFVCRNRQFPNIYIVDESNNVVQSVTYPGYANEKIPVKFEITAPDAKYVFASNLGGTNPTTLPYTETYVKVKG